MQAYYEIETQIPSNHQLNIQLPDTIPAGRAKIAVIYEVAELPSQTDKKKLMADFLASLRAIFERATLLRANSKLKTPDALYLATAIEANCLVSVQSPSL